LLDRFGLRVVIFVSSSLITLGQAVFLIGVAFGSFPVALLGRAIFGCGGENINVAQSVAIVRWFVDKELSMAYTVASCVTLLGSVINDIIEPIIVTESGSLILGLLVGLITCVFSQVCGILFIRLDRNRENLMPVSNNQGEEEKFNWKNISSFDLLFWCCLFNIIFVEVSVLCFNFIASGFLQNRFDYSVVQAGTIMSITFQMTVVLAPIFGVIVDKYGKRAQLMTLSAIIVLVFHASFMAMQSSFQPPAAIVLFVVCGIGYALSTVSAWISIPFVVKMNMVGTAYGLTYSCSSMLLLALPPVVGALQDNTNLEEGYFWVNCFLGMVALVGAVAGALAYVLDMKKGKVLNSNDLFNTKLA
jgi:MFS family permease